MHRLPETRLSSILLQNRPPLFGVQKLNKLFDKKNYENIFNVKIFFAFLINIYVFVVVIAVSCDVVVTVG